MKGKKAPNNKRRPTKAVTYVAQPKMASKKVHAEPSSPSKRDKTPKKAVHTN